MSSAGIIQHRYQTADLVEPAVGTVEEVQTAGECEDDLASLEAESASSPADPVLHARRGRLLVKLGRTQEAIDVLEAASIMTPDWVLPLKWLAGLLAQSSKVDQTERVLRRASELDPGDLQLLNDQAVALMRLHRHAGAQAILQKLLDRSGPDVAILSNLANTLVCLGDQDGALAVAHEALELEPTTALARRALCNVLPYHPSVTGSMQLEAMKACADLLPRLPPHAFENDFDPERPLVVGILSGTLRSHPVGWMTVAAFEALDPNQFQLVCFTQNTAANDPLTRRYRHRSEVWLEIGHLSDAQLALTARDHEIDILIDLGGYGDAGRMAACANRLAPVQIKWVGMQSHSSGLSEMDWFLSDRWETPAGFEKFYSEKLLRMTDGYVCYSPPPHAPEVGQLPALTNGFITFGCFNNLAKITPAVLEAWADILLRMPTARLVLKTHQLSDESTANKLSQTFASLGVDRGRVEFYGSSGHRATMRAYRDVDVILDPFPYSGGLTTCEALWMGIPVLTLPSETFASRHSASHLSNVGLADWITSTVGEYVELAAEKTADFGELSALRQGLRDRMRRSPLCDASRFGKAFGFALRRAWRERCAQRV